MKRLSMILVALMLGLTSLLAQEKFRVDFKSISVYNPIDKKWGSWVPSNVSIIFNINSRNDFQVFNADGDIHTYLRKEIHPMEKGEFGMWTQKAIYIDPKGDDVILVMSFDSTKKMLLVEFLYKNGGYAASIMSHDFFNDETDETDGNISWNISGNTFTISGRGAIPNYEWDEIPWENKVLNITDIVIEDGITSIGNRAFSVFYKLTSVSIPNSVKTIGEFAFRRSGLTSITIPNSVTFIGKGAFSMCENLTSIRVDNSNVAFSSENGVLFNKTRNLLIQYPAGKKGVYNIPNSVISIGEYAFSGCESLTSITIPNSVTSIGKYAFYYCLDLDEVINYATKPQAIDLSVFCVNWEWSDEPYMERCTLRVPAASVATYRTADTWKDFGKIEAIIE